MKRLRISAASFSMQNIKLYLRMFFYLLRIEAMLLFMPYSAVSKSIFEKKVLKKKPPTAPRVLIGKSIRMLELICLLAFWRPNCLRRSVVLRDSLVKDGIEADIKIGMQKNDGKFEAHAWVECYGMEIFKYKDYKILQDINREK